MLVLALDHVFEPLDRLAVVLGNPVNFGHLQFRLDLQNSRDQIDDARRNVANARNDLLPDLDFAGSITAPTDDDERVGQLDFQFDEAFYNASITFGLPLDREIERLNLRAAMINFERQIRSFEEARDNVLLDARRRRREIDGRAGARVSGSVGRAGTTGRRGAPS